MRKLLFIFSIFSLSLNAQELNCTVSINAEQTGQSNLQVFRTLQTEITEFMNKTSWTVLNIKQQEKIDCSLAIIINSINSDYFTASIQVQSSRPVFNSSYNTPILNFNDRQFNFQYTEFQPLNYNANTFDSNLISVLAFYAYTIIGLDASSYELGAGEPYFEEAKQIVNTAQQQISDGWSAQSGTQSRYRLNQDLLSPNFREFFDAMYAYHRNGLDYMAQNDRDAKQSIAISLALFNQLYSSRPNNFLTRVFFDSKAEEIASIFSGGPQVSISNLVSMLNKVSPTKSSYWQQIKL